MEPPTAGLSGLEVLAVQALAAVSNSHATAVSNSHATAVSNSYAAAVSNSHAAASNSHAAAASNSHAAASGDWWGALEDLRRHVQAHGCAPPTQHPGHMSEGVNLGGWVRAQRRAKQQLSSEQVAALEAVPGWYWSTDLDTRWYNHFEALKAFVDQFGQLPQAADGGVFRGYRLYAWVQRQRHVGRSLPPERGAALESLPDWQWPSLTRDEAWAKNLAVLRAFVQERSRLPKRSDPPFQGVNIGKWVSNQRLERRHKKLPQQRIDALEGVPMWKW
jgi:hypothetical protein